MKRSWILLASLSLVLVGCGSRPTNEAPPPIDPKAVPSVFDSGEHVPADRNELRALVDVPDYPDAKAVDNFKIQDKSIPPDEVRFLLTRKTPDSTDKVATFYEKALAGTRMGDAKHLDVLGRTAKGNDVHVIVNADGTGSSITMKIITYAKK